MEWLTFIAVIKKCDYLSPRKVPHRQSDAAPSLNNTQPLLVESPMMHLLCNLLPSRSNLYEIWDGSPQVPDNLEVTSNSIGNGLTLQLL
eukprot:m.88576 g.88576  ORF g.88576 m.88576 type:complete len:89 (+) comp11655_c0_seq4:2170-2436(+)